MMEFWVPHQAQKITFPTPVEHPSHLPVIGGRIWRDGSYRLGAFGHRLEGQRLGGQWEEDEGRRRRSQKFLCSKNPPKKMPRKCRKVWSTRMWTTARWCECELAICSRCPTGFYLVEVAYVANAQHFWGEQTLQCSHMPAILFPCKADDTMWVHYIYNDIYAW